MEQQTKETINKILSIFETGRVPSPSAYSTCSILSDGAGISYGKHQSTDKSGTLDLIFNAYINAGGKYSEQLKPYATYIRDSASAKYSSTSSSPDWCKKLIELLKLAGADPIMQKIQDEVFDSHYWNPAFEHYKKCGLKTAMGMLVLYDTSIHSGSGNVNIIRAKFPELSPANGGDEKAWIKAYVAARKRWLLSSPNPLVRKTIYRMEEFEKIISANNWELATPLSIRGVKI
jgi:chitosanase